MRRSGGAEHTDRIEDHPGGRGRGAAALRRDRFFEDRGWRVYEAENAEQAIALLDRHDEIRVVLTDVQMPGAMDGLKLAHYVRDRFPPTLLFVVSGQAPPSATALPARATFLPKPFDLNRVLRQIERSPNSPPA